MRPPGVPDWVNIGSVVRRRGETFPWVIILIDTAPVPRVSLSALNPISDPDLYYDTPYLTLREVVDGWEPVPGHDPDPNKLDLFVGQVLRHPERQTRWHISEVGERDKVISVLLQWADPLPTYVQAYVRRSRVSELSSWEREVSWYQPTLDLIAEHIGTLKPPEPPPMVCEAQGVEAEMSRYDLLTGDPGFSV